MALGRTRLGLTGLLLGLSMVAASCTTPDGASSESWGADAERYFRALSGAYEDNDVYGILDFYEPAAIVEKWRGAVRGGLPVADLLRWNSGDLGQQFESLYLGHRTALTQVTWPRSGDRGMIASTMEQGRIAGETVFELSASLRRSHRASPDVLAVYDGLAGAYAMAWSTRDGDDLARLYTHDAIVRDTISGVEVQGRGDIVSLPTNRWSDVDVVTGPAEDAADPSQLVYLGPRDYAVDPQQAIAVFEVTDGADCRRRVAVHWLLDGERIRREHRYQGVASARRCAPGGLPTGWWTDLALPGPSDRIVTGVFVTPGGRSIDIRNGTARLEALLRYGIERFTAADLPEPRIDTVTFEPSRSCEDHSGRVLDDGRTRDLFLCMYESDLCSGTDPCVTPSLNARTTVLHELGHAWMLDHVEDSRERDLLELTGLTTWDDTDVPWPERGVEYAAEVFAWGLLDEAIPVVRLGAPPCRELTASFRLLTDSTPLSTC